MNLGRTVLFNMATEHAKCEWAKLRGTTNVTCTPEYKDLVKKKVKNLNYIYIDYMLTWQYFRYTILNKMY